MTLTPRGHAVLALAALTLLVVLWLWVPVQFAQTVGLIAILFFTTAVLALVADGKL